MPRETGQPTSDRLATLLIGVGRYLHREMKTRVKGSLNPSQVQTLFYIQCHDRPLMRDVAEYLSIRPPSATVLVEELERLKLVQRVHDPNDKRQIRLKVTAKGLTLIRARKKLLLERIEALVEPLTAAERTQFIQTLEKILSTIDHV